MNLSTNLMPKHQAFSFEMISAVGNFKPLENVKINVMPSIDEAVNATLNSAGKERALVDEGAYNISSSQLLSEESYLESQKLLIIVTPTYNHPFQAYYLNRLAHTLKLVPPPLWIVVEITSQSKETVDILRSSGIMYRHLICKTNLTNMSYRSFFLLLLGVNHKYSPPTGGNAA